VCGVISFATSNERSSKPMRYEYKIEKDAFGKYM
jgi:hypothetical protein